MPLTSNRREQQMEAYATAIRLSDSVITVVGIVSHFIVVVLSWSHLGEDKKGSTFVVESYSIAVLVRLLSNWMIIHRTQTIANGNSIFFGYGLCTVIDKKFCCVMDAVATHLTPFTIFLVPCFMALRASILFKRSPKKKTVMWIVLAIYSVAFILLVILLITLLGSPVQQIPPNLWQEALVAPPYAELAHTWEIQLFFIGSNMSIACVPFTFILRFFMMRKLHSLSSNMSPKTHELHCNFVGLITFDAGCLLLGIIVSVMRFLSSAEYMDSPLVATLLNAFSAPILALMPTVQGLASLYYVPYIRKALLGCLGKSGPARILDSSSS